MNTQEDRLLTAEEVGKMLSLGTITIKRMVRRGQLPAIRLNQNVVRFRLSDVERLIESKRA